MASFYAWACLQTISGTASYKVSDKKLQLPVALLQISALLPARSNVHHYSSCFSFSSIFHFLLFQQHSGYPSIFPLFIHSFHTAYFFQASPGWQRPPEFPGKSIQRSSGHVWCFPTQYLACSWRTIGPRGSSTEREGEARAYKRKTCMDRCKYWKYLNIW